MVYLPGTGWRISDSGRLGVGSGIGNIGRIRSGRRQYAERIPLRIRGLAGLGRRGGRAGPSGQLHLSVKLCAGPGIPCAWAEARLQRFDELTEFGSLPITALNDKASACVSLGRCVCQHHLCGG